MCRIHALVVDLSGAPDDRARDFIAQEHPDQDARGLRRPAHINAHPGLDALTARIGLTEEPRTLAH